MNTQEKVRKRQETESKVNESITFTFAQRKMMCVCVCARLVDKVIEMENHQQWFCFFFEK